MRRRITPPGIAVLAAVVAYVLARRRRHAPTAPPRPIPDTGREAADGDLADDREVVAPATPAAALRSRDPEASEADVLAQAQDVDGEVLPHGAVGDVDDPR